MMKRLVVTLAVLFQILASAARADEKDQHFYFTVVPGRFALVGQLPDGGSPYKGTAEITERDGRFRLVKNVGGREVIAEGTVERADPGERDVVRFRWPGHAETCLVGSDLDNYSRLTCYWTVDGAEHKKPGLEAYFATERWP